MADRIEEELEGMSAGERWGCRGWEKSDGLSTRPTNYGPENYSYNPTTGNLASKAGVGYTYGAQNSNCPDGALSKAHAVTDRRDEHLLLRPEWKYGAAEYRGEHVQLSL